MELEVEDDQSWRKDDEVVVLTKPVSSDGKVDECKAPPLLQQILLTLFTNIRPGSDISHIPFQLPATFNIPKSQLQWYGESVYCTGTDLLSRCNQADSSIQRFVAVVSWSISTSRPLIFGVAPYNPILGETHHVSRRNLNLLLEQVSHHPPVSALHATDDVENLELIWSISYTPKFHGTKVETQVHGKRLLKLLGRGETYEMNSPKFVARFLPFTGTEFAGNVKIKCPESGFAADLCYGSHSFLGLRGNNRSIKGKIYHVSTMRTIFEITGQWDRTVSLKNVENGEVSVMYDASKVFSGLKTPMVKDLQEVRESESAMVWSELSKAIMRGEWGRAREVKNGIEERQREGAREREAKGEAWVPRHFNVTYSKDGGWECSPIQNVVPAAPIHLPL